MRHLAWITTLALLGVPVVVRAEPPADSLLDVPPYWLAGDKACGPLCLAFLDRYLGGTDDYRTVAARCPPGPQGVSLLDLDRAAKELGFFTQPFEGTVEQLRRLPFPAILHFHSKGVGFRHFGVLLGWDSAKQSFRIFDPPGRLVDAPYGVVEDAFTGSGLVIARTPLPPVSGLLEDRPSSLFWLALGLVGVDGLALLLLGWRAARRRRKLRVSAQVAAVLLVALGLASCEHRAAPPTTRAEALSPSPAEVNRGTVRQGETVVHSFQVVNRTGHPLTIRQVGST